MQGLLSQAAQAETPEAAAPPMSTREMPANQAEEFEAPDEELQEAKNDLVAEATRVLTSDKMVQRLLVQMSQTDPVKFIGEQAALVVRTVDRAMDDTAPEEIILPAVIEVAGELADIAEAAEIINAQDPKVQEGIAAAAIQAAEKAYSTEGEEQEVDGGE